MRGHKRKTTTSEPSLKALLKTYKSGLEQRIANQLSSAGIPFEYEKHKLRFVVPARDAKYTPDFKIGNIYIEAKGYFRSPFERQKVVLAKEANPGTDIRFVFSDARKPIYKGSPTTYAKWAEDHGFQWATGGEVPLAWLKEAYAHCT